MLRYLIPPNTRLGYEYTLKASSEASTRRERKRYLAAKVTKKQITRIILVEYFFITLIIYPSLFHKISMIKTYLTPHYNYVTN